MKRFIGTVSVIVFALGLAIATLGAVMIGWTALFGPKGGPHEPEGSFVGFLFGAFAVFVGLVGVAIGRALESASNQPLPENPAEPPVAADEDRQPGSW